LRINRSFSLIVFVFFIARAGVIARGLAPPARLELQYSALLKQAPSIDPRALQTALIALGRLQDVGVPIRSDVLMVIDYTKPSTERRLWVFDLNHSRVLFEELVAHGRNSGGNRAVQFSNQPGSLMSSLGVFVTADTYIGKHGLSLRLQGLEKGVNDKSMERAIVIHAAEYVSQRVGRREGRIGRSWGCPAVRPEVSRQLIETVQGGALLLAYYPENSWLQTSKLASPLRKTPVMHTRA
jgi:L,D-transpeptidase-like protein